MRVWCWQLLTTRLHEGISGVATAEALNCGKAPDLTYGTFSKAVGQIEQYLLPVSK